MLIEVRTKVTRIVGGKPRKSTDTFITDKEFMADAEFAVSVILNSEMDLGETSEFEVQSIKLSSIKELCYQEQGEHTYIATLKDVQVDDKGNEKPFKYKVLLWADSLTEANQRTLEIAKQGYDMSVEGIKEVNYIYINVETKEE